MTNPNLEELERLANDSLSGKAFAGDALIAKLDAEDILALIRRVREAEKDARRYRTIKNGYSIGLEIKCHKKRFSLAAQFTSYPYTTYPTLDEAVDAVIRQEQTK